ncbi:MAG TPA: redoxin family protein [Bacteroidota bacterium]|jgi:peroxiredoxin|nr:redoxin family protein [Bacteroidota bacterium]
MILNYLVITSLILEVIFLARQNYELKEMLKPASTINQAERLKPGEKVETIKLNTLDGSTKNLTYNEPSAKYLLFVLSTTCPHCSNNLARWQTIADRCNDEGFYVVGISIHDLELTRKYISSKKIGFNLTSCSDSSFTRKYKISAVPETILISGDGTVEKTWVGELTEEQVSEIVGLTSNSSGGTN